MSTDERKEILDLLASGKINVDEAATLLAKAKTPPAETEVEVEMVEEVEKVAKPTVVVEKAPEPVNESGKKPNWFRVRVNNLDTGKSKVSVNIPVRMLKFGFTVASHFTPAVDLNMQELQSMLMEGESGILVDVRDEESNEHVQVYLE